MGKGAAVFGEWCGLGWTFFRYGIALSNCISNCGHGFSFSRHNLAEFCSPSAERRARGRPGAGWHPASRDDRDTPPSGMR
jgi:hypothetical protein